MAQISKSINRKAILIAATISVFTAGSAGASSYFWDSDADTTPATGGTGNWDLTSLLWRVGTDTGTLTAWPSTGGDNDAVLAGTAGTLSLVDAISANDITVNPVPPGTYTIGGGQTLTLNGTVQSVLDVAASSTLTITSGMAGTNGFTKASSGLLILDNAGGSSANTLFGDISVTGGTLQAGSATLADVASNQVLRGNAVNLAGGTTLTTVGPATAADLRVGSLSGSGAVTPQATSAINLLSLTSSTFSGTITTTGGINIRGGNGTTQTFTGNLTGLTGTYGLNSGATLQLSGTGSTSGVAGAGTLAIRGGAMVLDNTGGNTSAASGRLSDSLVITGLGGNLTLLGNSAGSAETVGTYTMNNSQNSITVNNAGGGTGAALTLASFARTSGNAGLINFVGAGTGVLGSSGDNPRVIFTTVPGLTNSVIANSAASGILGFATVNGTDFAGYGANGVVAVTSTAVTGALASAGTQNSVLTGSATIAASNVSYNTLKIAPSGTGSTLDLTGAGALSTSGLLLAGSIDFTIQNTGGGTGGLIAANQRFVTVANAGTTLSVSVPLNSGTIAFSKGGDGILALTGTAAQLGGTGATKYGVSGGVLRGTLTNLGGGTSAGGVNTTIQLRGGVLEISGGGSLTRAIDLASTASGGSVTFDEGGTDRGDGGFSAIGGNASVTLVTAIGGSTAATLQWNDNLFLSNGYVLTMGSTKADSRIDLTNNVALDGNATTSNYFAREVRVADNTSSTTDVARLSGVISGSTNADLLKTGAGVLELTNNNTYSGNTIVQQGTLRLSNSTGSATGTGAVVVNSGGTLGGTGFIATSLNKGVTIRSGGKVAPGASAGVLHAALGTGSFDISGAVSATNSQSMQFELNADTASSDQVSLSGFTALNIGSGVLEFDDFQFTNLGGVAVGTYTLFDSSVAFLGTLGANLTGSSAGFTGTIASGDGGNDIVLNVTAVPEPASFGLITLVAGGLIRRRRSMHV